LKKTERKGKHTRRQFFKSLRLRFPETEWGWGLILSFLVNGSPCIALLLSAICALLIFCSTLNFAIWSLFPSPDLTQPYSNAPIFSFYIFILWASDLRYSSAWFFFCWSDFFVLNMLLIWPVLLLNYIFNTSLLKPTKKN
jgi:hypothetical protein